MRKLDVRSRKFVLILVMVGLLVGAGLFALVISDDGKGGDDRRRDGVAVTEADNGGEVSVTLNQQFVLDLEGSPDAPWSMPLANADSLAVIGSSLDPDGSVSVTYVPLEVTPAVKVSAERTGASPGRFDVTIRVVR